jgi:hypothetical protein
MSKFGKGDVVKWKWGDGYGRGVVQSAFTRMVKRKIAGEEVVRHGSKDNPAYFIVADDSNNVLKLGSELESEND